MLISGDGLAEDPPFEALGEEGVSLDGVEVLAQLGVGVGVAVGQVHRVAVVF